MGEDKAQSNLTKRKVSFDEAATVFSDPFSITIHDIDHSSNEHRYIDLERSEKGRMLVAVHTERGPNIRIISHRKATSGEKKILRRRR